MIDILCVMLMWMRVSCNFVNICFFSHESVNIWEKYPISSDCGLGPGFRLGSRLWARLPGWLPTLGPAPGLAPGFGPGSRVGSRLWARLPGWLPALSPAPGLAPGFGWDFGPIFEKKWEIWIVFRLSSSWDYISAHLYLFLVFHTNIMKLCRFTWVWLLCVRNTPNAHHGVCVHPIMFKPCTNVQTLAQCSLRCQLGQLGKHWQAWSMTLTIHNCKT